MVRTLGRQRCGGKCEGGMHGVCNTRSICGLCERGDLDGMRDDRGGGGALSIFEPWRQVIALDMEFAAVVYVYPLITAISASGWLRGAWGMEHWDSESPPSFPLATRSD